MGNVIKIACQGVATLPISEFSEMQGELKTLLKEDYDKLRNEIITEGFSFSLHVWRSTEPGNEKWYLLDGHQRVRVLRKLIEDEEFECPEIPYSLVFADNYEQAKRKLLGAASQYGRVQNDGLLEYMQGMELTPTQLAERYRFADLNVKKFVESNFDRLDEERKTVTFEVRANKEVSEDEFTFSHKCPRCSFEFNP